jgi:cell division protein FtsQ
LLAIVTGVLIFAGYRAAASASFFEARNVDISGAKRASVDQIRMVVRSVASDTGVWRADLAQISSKVEALPWVRTALVTRVLPDGLRVRVIERVPTAVVQMSSGKLVWVDDEAVTLSNMLPSDTVPPFFIRGWDEAGTSEARKENQERVRKYLVMSSEWGAMGLNERVSQVNLGDPFDVRALLAGEDAHIEVRLGSKNFATRLKYALNTLDRHRSTPVGPYISYLVADQDDKVTIGRSPNAPALSIDGGSQESASDSAETSNNSQTESDAARRSSSTDARTSSNGQRSAPKKKDRAQSEPGADSSTETRPRRVG